MLIIIQEFCDLFYICHKFPTVVTDFTIDLYPSYIAELL